MPWTVFWERNYFLEGTLVGAVLTAHVVRGAISGLGAVCLGAALAELRGLWPFKRGDAPPEAGAVITSAREEGQGLIR